MIIIILYNITLLRLPQWLRSKEFLQCRKLFLQRNSRQQRTSAMQKTIPGSIPRSGRSPGGGHGNPPQYSCLENTMDRGSWRATVPGVAKSRTRLKGLSMHAGITFLKFFGGVWGGGLKTLPATEHRLLHLGPLGPYPLSSSFIWQSNNPWTAFQRCLSFPISLAQGHLPSVEGALST